MHSQFEYRNTIAGSSPAERILIYFEKIRFASQKIEFLNFCLLAKKSVRMTLIFLETTKYSKKTYILFLFLCLHNFMIFMFLFLFL